MGVAVLSTLRSSLRCRHWVAERAVKAVVQALPLNRRHPEAGAAAVVEVEAVEGEAAVAVAVRCRHWAEELSRRHLRVASPCRLMAARGRLFRQFQSQTLRHPWVPRPMRS